MRRALLLLAGLTACGERPPAGPDPFDKGNLDVPRRWLGEGADRWTAGLASPVAAERALALWALGDLGARDAELAAAVRRGLEDPDGGVRLAALHALARRGLPPGVGPAGYVPGVLAALDAPEAGLRAAAREALGELGAEVVGPLVDRLEAADERTRWNAAAGLLRAGDAAEPATDALVAALAVEPDAATADEMALALARLGSAGPAALVRLLDGGDAARRRAAGDALRRAPAARVAAALRPLLSRDATPEAHDLATAIAASRPDVAADLVPQLVDRLGDEGPSAYDAADALKAVGAPARAALETAVRRQPGTPLAAAAKDLLEVLAEVP